MSLTQYELPVLRSRLSQLLYCQKVLQKNKMSTNELKMCLQVPCEVHKHFVKFQSLSCIVKKIMKEIEIFAWNYIEQK